MSKPVDNWITFFWKTLIAPLVVGIIIWVVFNREDIDTIGQIENRISTIDSSSSIDQEKDTPWQFLVDSSNPSRQPVVIEDTNKKNIEIEIPENIFDDSLDIIKKVFDSVLLNEGYTVVNTKDDAYWQILINLMAIEDNSRDQYGLFFSNVDARVENLDPKDQESVRMSKVFREVRGEQFAKSEDYRALERSIINQVIEENKYQASGLVGNTYVFNLGRQLGANFVCVSCIKYMENDEYLLTAKLVDVANAAVLLQKSETTLDGDDAPYQRLAELAIELLVSIGPKKTMKTKPDTFVQPPPEMSLVVIGNYDKLFVFPEDLSQQLNYSEAFDACENLDEFGYSDWRLPTRAEAELMFREKREIVSLEGIYWRFTNSRKRKAVNFSTGNMNMDVRKNQRFNVRPVRSDK